MVKSYKTHSFFNGLKFSCANTLRENKIKILITFALVLIAISTGVFIAVKSHSHLGRLQEISVDGFLSGFTASSSAFFQRCFSLTINVVILTGLSFAPYLYPLAAILFIYRGYLFGLNFALIFVFYGVGSIFTAVVIILPCQLLTLVGLVMFYVVLQRINCNCQKYGGTDCNRMLYFVIGLLLMLIINLVETLLLILLSGRVIMVI